jgi:hypothetical protein
MRLSDVWVPDWSDIFPLYDFSSWVHRRAALRNIADYITENEIVYPWTGVIYANMSGSWTYTIVRNWTYRLNISLSAPDSWARDINFVKIDDMAIAIKWDEDWWTNDYMSYRNVRVGAGESYNFSTQFSAVTWQIFEINTNMGGTVTITWSN